MTVDVSCAPGNRISVVGATGSGKSYTSRLLAELLDLQLIELDVVRDALPGGQANTDAFLREVDGITSTATWIVDGHYLAVRDLIWKRADTVVYLNYPLLVIFFQLAGRYLKKLRRGKTKPSNPGESPSSRPGSGSGNWKQRWNRLLKTLRERREYGQILHSAEYGRLKIIELKSRREVNDWIKGLAEARSRHVRVEQG